jgi:diguanylate cyclase
MVEETGLMDAMGRWVFQEACRQARSWADQGNSPYLSVNLSVHQLLRPRLGYDLELIMQACNTDPALLELEVTEGAIMTDPARTERSIRDLSDRGLSIALDDFGIGYSSLSRLKHLPISTIKIDKDFVLGLPNDPADRTMVRSIVQLADNLGVRSVAEGVESERHHDILCRIGCHFGQGFYFGKPCARDAFPVVPSRTAAG